MCICVFRMFFVRIQINDRWVNHPTQSYYSPLLYINMSEYDVRCEQNNAFKILIQNPRNNIDLLFSIFEFYFDIWPLPDPIVSSQSHMGDERTESHFGQVTFPVSCIYSVSSPTIYSSVSTPKSLLEKETSHMLEGLVAFENGNMTDIWITIPTFPQILCREIQLRTLPSRHHVTCDLCTDTDTRVYNLHPDSTHEPHEFCMTCLLKIGIPTTISTLILLVGSSRIFRWSLLCPICRRDVLCQFR